MLETFAPHIKAKLLDEIKDAMTYLDMAQQGECMLKCSIVDNIRHMACDEYSHAKFIYEYLMCMGVELEADTCEQYKNLECRMHSIYN